MFHKSAEKAENKTPKEDVSNQEATKGDPRGDDNALNTPEPSGDPVTPPSQKRPYNPSDAIEHQIEASDARTKAPGTEFEKWSNEQIKDYAVKLGIDGNDGLSRDEIISKIQVFQSKRMFANEQGKFENSTKDKKDAKKELDDQSKARDEEAEKANDPNKK